MVVAVVTGANKGIGLCIARQLLPTVSVLIMACRDTERGEAAAAGVGGVFEKLDLSSEASIDAFADRVREKYGGCDILVNNAGLAFKGSDPTPFAEQTKPTLAVNFYGTVRLSEKLEPRSRLVNVASMAGRLNQVSPERQEQFKNVKSLDELYGLVREFEDAVANGDLQGWGSSNYGFSKLALISYTMLKARQKGSGVNCCCPGYCATDMSSHRGTRSPEDGAKNAVMLADLSNDYNGVFIRDMKPAEW